MTKGTKSKKEPVSPELEAAEKAVEAAVLAHQEAVERHAAAMLAEDKAKEGRDQAFTAMGKAKVERDKLLPQAKVVKRHAWSVRTTEVDVAIVRRTASAVFVRIHGTTDLRQYRQDKSTGRYFAYPGGSLSSELIFGDK